VEALGSIGGGLAAVAFWGFIASCVVSGIWYSIREKQAQHDTLNRMIESGKEIDAELVDKIFSDDTDTEEGLKIAGYITMSAAPGLALLGYVLQVASDNDKIFTIMLGVGGLAFFVSIGLLFSARVAGKNKDSSNGPMV